ncbi:MAG: FK506-binding protein 2 [Parcubacteria bacterium C7867-001]|nr:MAG: FK506-binding protein 2 [Parcubacteria bacterium C7867-001]
MQITSTGIAVALAVVLALGLLFFGPGALTFLFPQETAASTDSSASPEGTTTTMDQASTQGSLPTTLTATDVAVGTGAEAKAGDTVTVNYVGQLPDGTIFDASQNHGQPFSFTLGAGQVIKGWDLGVAGMKVGGKRQLIIPPDMAYGSQGAGGVIPPNATLIFAVELVDVQSK